LDSRASEETRARVLEAAQKLNYIPVKPPTAQNRHVETHVVTMVPEHHDIRHPDLDLFTYQGLIEGARNHGYNVLTMVCHSHGKGMAPQELQFLDRSSDGFIFTVSMQEHWTRVLQMLAKNDVPTVICYRRDVPDGVAWVDVDNEGAMHQAVEHLVGCGHSRIAFLAGPTDNFDANERRSAWVAAMQERGLDASERFIVQAAGKDYVQDPDAIASVSSLGVTAAVCFNDTLALALWDALEAQNLSVPEDISIIGMDNRIETKERGLSTLAFSFADVGCMAMEAWIDLKKGVSATDCSRTAPVHLITRDSVRCLN
jgi:DNA-binding LacI/PurR family transcriptional regulator